MADSSTTVVDVPAATAPQQKRSPLWRGLASYPVWVSAAVVGGAVLRVARWTDGKSLNSDELWIALNLQHRSFLDLLRPLDYDQLAPLGWLWLEKTVILVSRGEMALRVPSLVAGCTVVALVGVLARRLLPVPFAVAAVVLVAGGPILIYQSSQLKQYSFEAATCVLLIILALRTLDEPARRRILAFWITGAAAVWFATTAIFVVASVGGLLVLFALLERHWVLARRHVLAAAPAGASMLIVYLLTPPPPAWLYDWWSQIYPGSLAPESVGVRSGLDWAGKLAKGFSAWSLGATFHVVGGLVLVLLGVGVLVLLARMPRQGAVVIAPLVTGFVLALLRLYPMSGRLALWLVPIVLILLCAGVDGVVAVCRRLLDRLVAQRRAADAAGVALSVAGAVLLVLTFLPELGRPPTATNADRYATAEQAVRFIAENRRPGDKVLVTHNISTSAPMLWYGPKAGLRADGEYSTATGEGCRGNTGVAALAGVPRVWLFHVTWVSRWQSRRHPERAAFARYGRLVAERWFHGIVVLLYQAPAAARALPASAPCVVLFPPES